MNEQEQQWGTLEELLLACAVTRYGTENWHSVSAELIRHLSENRHRFTPANCSRRYTVIRRRLGGGTICDDLVAELRKLRVQELKSQVEKHDLAIELMEMKLKRLEETDLSEDRKPIGSVGRSLNESNSTTSVKDEPVIEPVVEEFEPGDEVPLAVKKIVIKSQPLIKILTIIRAHKNGSIFERRLKSQESERYKKMIRQHVDLQTVRKRLEKGLYLHSHRKFFRDLLLLFTNAIIFFSKTSDEYSAASELQKLVITQMAITIPKPAVNKRHIETYTRMEGAPTPPIVVCRRRSSIGSKPGSNSVAVAKSTKEVEVKVKMKNLKFDVKAKERAITKKPDVKENNTKGISKKALRVKELESSSSEETDDEEEIERLRNRKDVKKNGTRGGGRRETVREADNAKLIGKKGRPGKGPVPVVTRGRGLKREKESIGEVTVVEDRGRTRKRPRR